MRLSILLFFICSVTLLQAIPAPSEKTSFRITILKSSGEPQPGIVLKIKNKTLEYRGNAEGVISFEYDVNSSFYRTAELYLPTDMETIQSSFLLTEAVADTTLYIDSPEEIAALQQAGVSNPLMLLDEIDKTSSDYKGDTSAALLEVLDPEQNSRFMDHYIEVPQDLSEVLFIATANDVQGIPRPLLDRMELIEIAGYTENEKEHIAKEHLIPKQMEENGIEKGKLTIQSAALKKIINNYTKEAGVRNLERTIGQICRKTARLIMEEDKKKVTVTSKNLSDFLGKEHFNYLMANKKDEIGISRGLAWTQVGGDTLQIEVNVMPGKGELMLTGQLGDVMKESAQAGITYIRSIASDYKVEPEFFQENDIHVHIPEGAVPKDGPSAGITMATAILSAIIKKPVRADLAMTGEITLRGRVLPIGGLKEKLLAAKYAKIKEVLVPAENKPDIQELDKEITDGLTITFVSSMKEVLNKALV